MLHDVEHDYWDEVPEKGHNISWKCHVKNGKMNNKLHCVNESN